MRRHVVGGDFAGPLQTDSGLGEGLVGTLAEINLLIGNKHVRPAQVVVQRRQLCSQLGGCPQRGHPELKIGQCVFAEVSGEVAAVVLNAIDDHYLVCWQASDDLGEWEIYRDLLTSEGGVLLDDVEISYFGPTGAGSEDYAAGDVTLAHNTNHNEYLACWRGDTNDDGLVDGEFEVFCRFLTNNLGFVGQTLRVSEQGGTGDPEEDISSPSVAYNFRDNNYLVCWSGDQIIPLLAAVAWWSGIAWNTMTRAGATNRIALLHSCNSCC